MHLQKEGAFPHLSPEDLLFQEGWINFKIISGSFGCSKRETTYITDDIVFCFFFVTQKALWEALFFLCCCLYCLFLSLFLFMLLLSFGSIWLHLDIILFIYCSHSVSLLSTRRRDDWKHLEASEDISITAVPFLMFFLKMPKCNLWSG